MRCRRKSKPHASSPEDTKKCLFQAAKRIFCEKGFDGTTIRDLAREAGVNISLVSYYFQGKEGLYRACLETISNASLESAERILIRPKSTEDFKTRLQIFMQEFLALHLKEWEVSHIVLRDFANSNPVAKEIFFAKFAPIFQKLGEFLQMAQEDKILAAHLDPKITVLMFGGILSHLLRFQQNRGYAGDIQVIDPNSMELTIAQIITQFTEGILQR